MYRDVNGNNVYILGSSLAVQFGFKVSAGTSLCMDDNLNVGVVDTVSFSTGTTMGINVSKSLSIINTDSIMDLNGLSIECGGSISPINYPPFSFVIGYDYTVSINGNTTKGAIYSLSTAIGYGPIDEHLQITYSNVQKGIGYVVTQLLGGNSVRTMYSMIKNIG